MKSLNAITREFERRHRFAPAGLLRCLDFGRRHTDVCLGQRDPIKLGRQREQGSVATRCDVGHDAAYDLLHVLGRFAFDREKAAKTLRKVRALTVQAKGHG